MRLIILAMLLHTVFAMTAQAAPVQDALRVELSLLAKDIAKIVQKHGGGSIAVGEFSSSTDVVGHGGPGVQLILSEELQKAGLHIDINNYIFEVSGRYQPFHDTKENRQLAGGNASDAQGLLTVKLVAFLIDRRTGDFLAERPTGRLIFGTESVPTLLGLSTSTLPVNDPEEISENFLQALNEPQIEIHKTKVNGITEQYAIEILKKKAGRYVPVQISLNEDKPFAELYPDDIYGIRLINNSEYEAAVDLKIDGVNNFQFSESSSKFWILDPKSHTDILGWHKNDRKSIEFKVVDNFSETAVSKLNLKPSSKVGLITATFSASWSEESSRPKDEPLIAGRGTGFGQEIEFTTESVHRTIGLPRDTISIRYER